MITYYFPHGQPVQDLLRLRNQHSRSIPQIRRNRTIPYGEPFRKGIGTRTGQIQAVRCLSADNRRSDHGLHQRGRGDHRRRMGLHRKGVHGVEILHIFEES